MEYCVNDSNRKTNDSFISSLKGETVILTQVYGVLSFCNISRESSVIYPVPYIKNKFFDDVKIIGAFNLKTIWLWVKRLQYLMYSLLTPTLSNEE